MKIKFKLLALSTPSLLLTPLILSGCSNNQYNNDQKTANLKAATIEEFKNYCSIPHPSDNLKSIFNFLLGYIKGIGYQPHYDNYAGDDVYGNIWFDIPATTGCENWKKLILQAHMDMVYAGPIGDKTSPIVPVIEQIYDEKTKSMQTVMHSKDHKTSLGADDGQGVATILALARNKEIQHGPIRCIFTGDEETTTGGAESLDKTVLDSDYLINIDGENDTSIAVSCYGCTDGAYQKNISKDLIEEQTTGEEKLLSNYYRVYVNDLHGGHSGDDIAFKYGNAERFVWNILNDLTKKYKVQLTKFDHIDKDGNEQTYQFNSLIPNAGVSFFSDATLPQLQEIMASTKNELSKVYTGENWDTVIFGSASKADKPVRAINIDVSSKLVKCFGDKEEGLPYGVINYIDEPKHIPGASSNIGPTKLDVENVGDVNFNSASLGRSNLISDIKTFANISPRGSGGYVKKSYKEIWEKYFNDSTSSVKTLTTAYAWEDSANNPIKAILTEAYVYALKKQPEYEHLYGLLEESYFITKNENMKMATIGPRIDNCHSTQETFFLDTLDNELKALIYVLEHFNQI